MKTKPGNIRIPRINQRGIFKAEAVNDDGTISGALTLRNNQIWPAVIQETKIKPIADKMIGRQYTVIVSQAISHSLIRCLIEDQLIGTNGTFTIQKIIDPHRASGTFQTGTGTYNGELLTLDQNLNDSFRNSTCNVIVIRNERGTIICNPKEKLHVTQARSLANEDRNDSESHNKLIGKKGEVIILKFQRSKYKYGRGTLTVNGKDYDNVFISGFQNMPDKRQYIGKSFHVIVNQYDEDRNAYICGLTDNKTLSVSENKQKFQDSNKNSQTTDIEKSLLHSCVRKYMLLRDNPEIGKNAIISKKGHGYDIGIDEDDSSLHDSILAFFDRNADIADRMTDQLSTYTDEIKKQYLETLEESSHE